MPDDPVPIKPAPAEEKAKGKGTFVAVTSGFFSLAFCAIAVWVLQIGLGVWRDSTHSLLGLLFILACVALAALLLRVAFWHAQKFLERPTNQSRGPR